MVFYDLQRDGYRDLLVAIVSILFVLEHETLCLRSCDNSDWSLVQITGVVLILVYYWNKPKAKEENVAASPQATQVQEKQEDQESKANAAKNKKKKQRSVSCSSSYQVMSISFNPHIISLGKRIKKRPSNRKMQKRLSPREKPEQTPRKVTIRTNKRRRSNRASPHRRKQLPHQRRQML